MKHLILAAAVATLPLFASAQKLELGANVGSNFSFAHAASRVSPDFSIKAAYNINKRFQVGLSSTIHWQAYEINYYDLYFEDNFSGEPVDIHLAGSQAVHSLKAFFNVKHSIGRAELYSGFSGGYMMGMGSVFLSKRGLDKGYTVGAQAGGTYYVTKKLGINAEVGANYVNMGGDGDYDRNVSRTRLTASNFPLTVGVRYKLF